MNNVVALVDFTRVCDAAIAQAGIIARETNAKLYLLHVAPKDSTDSEDHLKSEIVEYSKVLGGQQNNMIPHVVFGDFFEEINDILKSLEASMVVVGTHGMRGKQRNLFSRNIARLLSSMILPTMVVQGQRDQATSPLETWLDVNVPESELKTVEWLSSPIDAEILQAENTTDPEEIETEAFDNHCDLIVWHGRDEDGISLILNHFGIPVLLL
jgi:nucleotide-binding universal stress UspA family protein